MPFNTKGEELSPNIFYTAEAVNQQATPAVDYLLAEGKKKFYLLGIGLCLSADNQSRSARVSAEQGRSASKTSAAA